MFIRQTHRNTKFDSNGKGTNWAFKLLMHPPSSKQRIKPLQKAAPGYRIVEFETAALRLDRSTLLCKKELEKRKKITPPAEQDRPSNREEKVRVLARRLLLSFCRSRSGLGLERSSGGGSRGGRLLRGAEVGLVAQRATSRTHARCRLGRRNLRRGFKSRSGSVSRLRLSGLGLDCSRGGGLLGDRGRWRSRSNSSNRLWG